MVAAAIAVYLLLFYRAALPSLYPDDAGGTRWRLLWQSVLLLDTLAQGWFGEPAEFSLFDRLPVALLAGGILLAALLIGCLLLDCLRAARGLTRLERFVFSAGLGLSALSLYTLSVGLVGGLRSTAAVVVPGVLTALLAAWRWQTSWRRANAFKAASAEAEQPWLNPRLLWLAAPFVVAIFLGAMLPPVEFDVREYHLQAPKEFYQQGRIAFVPHNVYANMPLGAEMLSLFSMMAARSWWLGALVGKTLIAGFVPLTALALLAAGRRCDAPSAGIVAALVYISLPWMARAANLGLIEGAVAFYLTLAVYGAGLWYQCQASSQQDDQPVAPPNAYLALAGLMAGSAAACKYPALLFVVLPLTVGVLFAGCINGSGRNSHSNRNPKRERGEKWNPRSPRLRFGLLCFCRSFKRWLGVGSATRLNAKAAAVFLLFAALAGGLWYAKNAALAGNPVYPLLYRWLDGETRTDANDAQWCKVHRPPNFSPADAARCVVDVAGRSEWHSPLIIPLAVLALVSARRRFALLLWAYFGFVILAWWLSTHRIDRFWIPALPLLALAAGFGATWTRDAIWRRVLIGFLLLGLAANFLFIVGPAGGYNRYFASYQQLRTSPERVNPWHLYLNQKVGENGRVLVVGDAQVFDLAVPIDYNTVFDDCLFETWYQGRTPAEFHAELERRGVTHVYVNWGEIARYRSPGNYGFTDLVQPAVFDELVAQGVLAPPEPSIEGSSGEVYRVLPTAE